MDVGHRIKALREERNITVNKLANLSGISQSYLRDIELGNKKPTVEYIEYICYGLQISLQDFFTVEETGDELYKAINRLNAKQQKLLLDFINSLW